MPSALGGGMLNIQGNLDVQWKKNICLFLTSRHQLPVWIFVLLTIKTLSFNFPTTFVRIKLWDNFITCSSRLQNLMTLKVLCVCVTSQTSPSLTTKFDLVKFKAATETFSHFMIIPHLSPPWYENHSPVHGGKIAVPCHFALSIPGKHKFADSIFLTSKLLKLEWWADEYDIAFF